MKLQGEQAFPKKSRVKHDNGQHFGDWISEVKELSVTQLDMVCLFGGASIEHWDSSLYQLELTYAKSSWEAVVDLLGKVSALRFVFTMQIHHRQDSGNQQLAASIRSPWHVLVSSVYLGYAAGRSGSRTASLISGRFSTSKEQDAIHHGSTMK